MGPTTLSGTTPAIAAGDTADVALTGTWTATDGGVTLTATADATGTVTETNENNNVFGRSLVVGRGAAVPYTEYEAEDAAYRGTLLYTDSTRPFGHTNFATESSGRESVRLNTTGDYVEFTSMRRRELRRRTELDTGRPGRRWPGGHTEPVRERAVRAEADPLLQAQLALRHHRPAGGAHQHPGR